MLRERERFLPVRRRLVFQCKSARAAVHEVRPFVWRAEYTGPMCRECFDDLRAKVVQATQEARVLLIRMDRALSVSALVPEVPPTTYRINRAPAAVIVRPDQFDVWQAYADRMADIGIMRAVFLESQLAQAHRLVDCLAGVSALRAAQTPYPTAPRASASC